MLVYPRVITGKTISIGIYIYIYIHKKHTHIYMIYIYIIPLSLSIDRYTQLCNQQQAPGFQGSVPVFRASRKTVHHSQTQRLKPNSHCCWEFTPEYELMGDGGYNSPLFGFQDP
jgi:hypothetical protein